MTRFRIFQGKRRRPCSMQFFLLPLFPMVFGVLLAAYLIPSISPYVLLFLAIVGILFTFYSHRMIFALEYKNMSWATIGYSVAPWILTTVVILMVGGYLFYLVGSGSKVTLPTVSSAIPPPSTATNPLTWAIGSGLVSSGTSSVNSASSASSAKRPDEDIIASLLSRGI